MKRIEFNELIEKAFSMGYEYAQKEFGAIKRENKKKKREWEIKNGHNSYYSAEGVAKRKFAPKGKKFYVPTDIEIDSISDEDAKIHNNRHKIENSRNNEYFTYRGRDINNIINTKDDKLKRSRLELKVYMNEGKENLKKYKEGGLKSIIDDPNSFFKRNKSTKSLKKKAGLALAGTAAVAGAAYGAKKLYDKKKKEAEKEQNKKAED